MRRLLLVLSALPLLACSNLDDYFSTMAAEGLLLGLEEVPPEFADEVELGAAATATSFVAAARSLTNFEANLVDDADRVVITRGDSITDLDNLGDGLYEVDSSIDEEFEYVVGGRYRLQIERAGKAHYVDIVAPAPPELVGLPEIHSVNTPITVDLTGQGFNNYIAIVGTVDAEGNLDLTYDSRPRDAGEYIDWIRARNEVTTVELPASAFPRTGTPYLVAIAGMVRAKDADFEALNPLVSNFAAGSAAPALVTTAP
jgi:hypothetical protein